MAESMKPVAWVRRHPDGALTAEFKEDAAIEQLRKESGAWVPLYTAAQLEQARREERESCLNTRIVDHDMLGSPITARMILELGDPRNEKGSS